MDGDDAEVAARRIMREEDLFVAPGLHFLETSMDRLAPDEELRVERIDARDYLLYE